MAFTAPEITLPSTLNFYNHLSDYIEALNQLVALINQSYVTFQSSQSPGFFTASTASSVPVATGAITITLDGTTNKAYAVGMQVRVASNASPANYVECQVTAYAHPTLTLNRLAIGGSGTFTDGRIGLSSNTISLLAQNPGASAATRKFLSLLGGTTSWEEVTPDPAASLSKHFNLGGF